jgi:monomeric sarcosine oxidase
MTETVTSPRLDVAALRRATPGTRHARHFNAAGSALPSEATLATVIEHLKLESRLGGYEAAEASRDRANRVYDLAAQVLGAQPEDVALVESATVAWHRAVDALRLRPGDRILASASSYVSSALHLLELRHSLGVTVEVLPIDATGGVDLDALDRALRRPAALVTAAHVPTSSGLIESAAEIGARTTAAGVPLLLDATQSVGQMTVDVGLIGCDLAVATGRKFVRGPRGTGLLYVSPRLRATLRSSHPDVRGAHWIADERYDLEAGARRYETWEAAHALRLGLGTALAEALDLGLPHIHDYLRGLAGRLRAGLATVPGIRVVDPPAAGGAIVTFVRDGEEPRETVRSLRENGFHLVTVPASHSQWDLGRRGLPAVVRASVHVYNDADEVDALVAELARPAPASARRPAPETTGTPALLRTGDRADVVVVGAGIHGSVAAWQLANRGASVIQVEQFPDGHTEGSSHGHTRMIRRAYPSPVWDGLLDRAYDAWAELEQASGERLVTTVGGLYARMAGAAGGLRGPGCVQVDSAQAAEIFPALRLGEDFTAVFDPAAGIIDAATALRGLRRLGRAYGVDRRDSTPVLDWAVDGGGVRVRTAHESLYADRLVICAGPWTATLLPEFGRLLDVVRIVNVHIGATDPRRVCPPALGPFSVEIPGVGLLYGIPAYGGSAVKIGLDHGPADDPQRPQWPVTAEESAVLLDLARRFLPDADGGVVDSVSCRYTMAPGNRFAVGPLPDRPQVLVAAACSGHGFKFGPAIGAALADLATGKQRPDLDFLAPEAMGVNR